MAHKKGMGSTKNGRDSARTCGFVDVTVHNDYTGRPRYLTAEKQPAQ